MTAFAQKLTGAEVSLQREEKSNALLAVEIKEKFAANCVVDKAHKLTDRILSITGGWRFLQPLFFGGDHAVGQKTGHPK